MLPLPTALQAWLLNVLMKRRNWLAGDVGQDSNVLILCKAVVDGKQVICYEGNGGTKIALRNGEEYYDGIHDICNKFVANGQVTDLHPLCDTMSSHDADNVY